MVEESQNKNYEEAAKYRDMLSKFNYIRKKRVPAYLYSQNPNLKKDLAEKSIKELKELLPHLFEIPKRIECYDISDLSGKNSVGSMVVALDGKLDRSKYRRFKIKSVEGADDFAKMAEALERRLKRMKKDSKGWERPALIVLDGGRGQLSAVRSVYKSLGIENLPLVGLAKKEETLVYFSEHSYKEVSLDSEGSYQNAFKLLIRLRDESHRFAQAYHHKLRLKELLK
jgi:excinuclease ABC subunit C